MKSITGRIEVHYAAVQGTYWASICTLVGFSTVYLSHQGLSDTLIGLAYSLFGILSILLQMLLSNFSDHHAEIPLKSVVAAVFGAAVVCGASLLFIPLPIAGLVALYFVGEASQASAPGLANALMMQYVDRGLPVNYGWPRGIGSIGYAVSAFILGRFVASRSPDILLPIFIALATAAGLSVIAMPNPDRMAALRPAGTAAPAARGGEDDRRFPPTGRCCAETQRSRFFMRLFVAAVGQSSGITFLIRIMQSAARGRRKWASACSYNPAPSCPHAPFLRPLKKWRAPAVFWSYPLPVLFEKHAPRPGAFLGFVYGAWL
jgi:MFS family permease